MKAIYVTEFGGPEVLQVAQVPIPQPGTGEVLVRLHAAGVNPVETYIRSGKYAKLPALPYTPGTDGAGRVETLGAGVTHLHVGQRVYVAGSRTGTYAEYCVSNAHQVHALPEDVQFAQGAALGVPYATAYRAIFQRTSLPAGGTLLIRGATGGVGIAAVQFAKSAKARVLATGGTPEGLQRLLEHGADAVFDHHNPGTDEQIRHATDGQGVDLILEMLANINLAQDLQQLRPNGSVLVIGSRGRVEIDPRDLMLRESNVGGVMLARATPAELQEIHQAIARGLSDHSLHPVVSKYFTLAQAPAAHATVLEGGGFGKIVLTL